MIPTLPWPFRLLCASLLIACGVAARADELSDVHRLFYSGQTAEAMRQADAFLAGKPKDPQMRFLKGVMLTDLRRGTEAIEQFQKLTEDYPDLPEPYNNLAALYASTGDYDKARVALQQALRTNPGYATAHENLGDVYAKLAAQEYAQAMKLEASNVTAPPKLARVRELFISSRVAAPVAAASAPNPK